MNQIRQLRDSQTYATRSCLLVGEAIRRHVPIVRSVQGIMVTAVVVQMIFSTSTPAVAAYEWTHARSHG